MPPPERVNILLVDDQPAKLLSYEAILDDLGETLIRANSAREALEILLKTEVAIILVDVCMPELDGFQLAEMIRDHPRFANTAIVFVSAVQQADVDRLRAYELGAVDYVPVPVVPDLLRAKVKVFAELYRKGRELKELNRELERRVAMRTAELEAANSRLRLAVDVARLSTLDWDMQKDELLVAETPGRQSAASGDVIALTDWLRAVHQDDRDEVAAELRRCASTGRPYHQTYRTVAHDGKVAWREARAHVDVDDRGRPVRLFGVLHDVSEHKSAEERQRLMLQELHHRVKNTLATVQAISALTIRTTPDPTSFFEAFNSRLISLSRTHTMLMDSDWQKIRLHDLLESELSSFWQDTGKERISLDGPPIELPAQLAVSLGLAVHELVTNAAKYGSLSVPDGRVLVQWEITAGREQHPELRLVWREQGGPPVHKPKRRGFGSTLLDRLFAGQNGARNEARFDRAGFSFDLAIPWLQEQAVPNARY